jgi:hypothetical protein
MQTKTCNPDIVGQHGTEALLGVRSDHTALRMASERRQRTRTSTDPSPPGEGGKVGLANSW